LDLLGVILKNNNNAHTTIILFPHSIVHLVIMGHNIFSNPLMYFSQQLCLLPIEFHFTGLV